MNLDFTPEQVAFRAEIRGWLSANVPSEPLITLECEEGFHQHVEWERKLASGNWGMVTWPEAVGGRGLDLIEWLIFEEEYWSAGAPLRVNQNGIFLLGPTIMEFGTDEQKKRFLTPMAAGEVIWAQAWSEPGAGSDMAAITTTAVRDGDHYVINGQKTWSSRASFGDWGFGLFRKHEADASLSAREAVTKAWMDTQAYAYNTYSVAAKIMAGGSIGAEASLNKIFWSELDQSMNRTAMHLLGAAAELRKFAGGSQNDWLEGYIFSLSGPIYAGSNEVQRNITAERLLGLPRVGAG